MPGYANALARYFANLFGGATNQSQKLQGQKNGEASGSNISVRKRSSANNRTGSSFATASQGDAAYYGDEGSTPVGNPSKPLKKKQLLSRTEKDTRLLSQAEKDTPVPPAAPGGANKSMQQATPHPVPPHQDAIPNLNGPTELRIDDRRVYLKSPSETRQFVDLGIFKEFDLRYVKFLGSGGQGEVHQVADGNTRAQYALKIIKQNSAAKKYEKEALEVIKEHSYPGIIHLESSLEDSDFLYLLTQFVEGLTVRDIIPYMEQFSWDRKREFVIPLLAELCLAIDYLHQLGYVHRDIKASNCFLDMFGHVTIGDFGSCIQKSLIKARVIFGTVPYTISPEMFCKQPYGTEADYWGIGVLACELLLGFFPFDWFTRDEIKSRETVNQVIQTIKSPQIPSDVPEDVQQVLFAFLEADPKRRLGSSTLGGIESIERHPFFNGIHWDRFRNPGYRKHSLPVLKLMKAIQRKKAAKAAQAAALAAAADNPVDGAPGVQAMPPANYNQGMNEEHQQRPPVANYSNNNNNSIPVNNPNIVVKNDPHHGYRPTAISHQSGGDIG